VIFHAKLAIKIIVKIATLAGWTLPQTNSISKVKLVNHHAD